MSKEQKRRHSFNLESNSIKEVSFLGGGAFRISAGTDGNVVDFALLIASGIMEGQVLCGWCGNVGSRSPLAAFSGIAD